MDGITYPSISLGSGDAIQAPFPPLGNATGYGTNIPGTVVNQYSQLPTLDPQQYFPTTLQGGIDSIAKSVAGGLGAIGGAVGGTGITAGADAGTDAVTTAENAATSIGSLLSRIVTVIAGLATLFIGFHLLGATTLNDAIRSLKPA